MNWETDLTNNELERYSRQIILNNVGPKNQIKLRNSKVLIVGLGGLGSPVLTYLVSSGIGTIGIVDFDNVEKHNLQRQNIHRESFIGKSKVESAVDFALNYNSSAKIVPFNLKLDGSNIEKICSEFDVLVDCTDSIECRYLIADYASSKNKHTIVGSVLKWEGQIIILPGNGPCYRCIFPEIKQHFESCESAGVVGPMCGMIGSLQAVEVIKIIINDDPKPLLLTYDGITNQFRTITVRKKSKECVPSPIFKPATCAIENDIDQISFITWNDYLSSQNEYLLVDVRPSNLFEICKIKNSINVEMNKLVAFKNETDKKIAFICRRGITAQRASLILKDNGVRSVVIRGGLESYKNEIDTKFPL